MQLIYHAHQALLFFRSGASLLTRTIECGTRGACWGLNIILMNQHLMRYWTDACSCTDGRWWQNLQDQNHFCAYCSSLFTWYEGSLGRNTSLQLLTSTQRTATPHHCSITFIPFCSLLSSFSASTIALCMRHKLKQELNKPFKVPFSLFSRILFTPRVIPWFLSFFNTQL